jgi:hypothetical protein
MYRNAQREQQLLNNRKVKPAIGQCSAAELNPARCVFDHSEPIHGKHLDLTCRLNCLPEQKKIQKGKEKRKGNKGGKGNCRVEKQRPFAFALGGFLCCLPDEKTSQGISAPS